MLKIRTEMYIDLQCSSLLGSFTQQVKVSTIISEINIHSMILQIIPVGKDKQTMKLTGSILHVFTVNAPKTAAIQKHMCKLAEC